MSAIKMVALRKHPFGTGEREAGEEYEASADEAAILTALKWAKNVSEKNVPAPETEQETVASPEPEPKVTNEKKGIEAGGEEGKRTYRRRDMKAKG